MYVSNRQVYTLSHIYSSHILNMVIIHDVHQPCGPLMSVPVTHYINIMILIIGAHNMTLDLWSMLHNTRLMYTTYVQHAHNQQEMLKPQTCFSKDFLPEYWQMYSNLCMLRDTKIPNKKQSMPLNPLSYSMPSSLLKEAIILLQTVEIEEICLHTLQHLLEEMHCIALSSPKAEEEDGTATSDSGKEEEDKDNNNLNTTPPMHHNG